MRAYRYEHWMLVSSIIGMVLLPWILAWAFCPALFSVLVTVPLAVYIKANVWSAAWGIANLLACLCLVRIGFSLTMGLLTGIGLPVGILIPMIYKGSGEFSKAPSLYSSMGGLLVIMTAVLILAVVLIAWAGFDREKYVPVQSKKKTFKYWLFLATFAGVLQVGLSFAFVYSQGPIIQPLLSGGASEVGVISAVWAVTLLGGAILNIIYPAYLIWKRHTLRRLLCVHDFFLCIIRAILFMSLVLSLGTGMLFLGTMGASLGFGIYQGLQVVYQKNSVLLTA
jgi:hypothetical protein